ncbi:MAG TPA: sensor histidine kinase [Gemmatimonadaceae bacterium]|nr:sensor histidine kinase [Gemmatimonadaceae bacterium]
MKATRQLGRLGTLVGAWCAVVLFTASQYSLIYTATGGAAHFPMALRVSALQWLPWLVVGPCVVLLARRFPLRGAHWPQHLAIHLVATVVVAAVVTRSFGAAFLRNVHSEAIVYWLLVASTHLADSLRRARERESHVSRLEVQLADARLAALQSQLHPHFLFNTLHAVSSLIHDDADAAEDMLTALSDLLRTTLSRGSQREVPLHDEIDFLERYLEIQKMRLGDRLQVTLDVPSEVADILVPSFAIQPLVENAIRHAIAPRRAGGHLEIRAIQVDGRLRLTVADDGPGFPTEAGRGIGLENTRERLAQLYGDTCRFTITDRPTGGAAVTIEIVARTKTA